MSRTRWASALSLVGGVGDKGLATSSWVIVAAWVAGLAAFAVVTVHDDAERDEGIEKAGDIALEDLRPGDCYIDPAGEAVYNVRGVPCDDPHDSEVYAVYDLAGSSEFPGDKRVERTSDNGCRERFRGFVGRDYDDSALQITYWPPTREAWAMDDREVICAVFVSGDQATGSLRNSRR